MEMEASRDRPRRTRAGRKGPPVFIAPETRRVFNLAAAGPFVQSIILIKAVFMAAVNNAAADNETVGGGRGSNFVAGRN